MKGSKTPAAASTFTEEERAAMKERATEVKRSSRRGAQSPEDAEREVLAKMAEMSDADRALAERIHAIVMASAPDLTPRTWYGMPAYARDGKLICFFQPAGKFKARYATLGFEDNATLDEDTMWPTAWAITKLDRADEARIAELVRKAVG